MDVGNREIANILDKANAKDDREIDQMIQRSETLLCDVAAADCERLLKACKKQPSLPRRGRQRGLNRRGKLTSVQMLSFWMGKVK